jgi:hypothetical protein
MANLLESLQNLLNLGGQKTYNTGGMTGVIPNVAKNPYTGTFINPDTSYGLKMTPLGAPVLGIAPKAGVVPFGDASYANIKPTGMWTTGDSDLFNYDTYDDYVAAKNLGIADAGAGTSNSFWDPKNWGMNGYGGLLLGGANLLGGIFNFINASKYAKEALGLQKEQLAMANKQFQTNKGIIEQNYEDTVVARTGNNNGRYGDEAKADALVALNALKDKMDGVA